MVFNCKVFDKNGNLKKIVKSDEMLSEASNIFFEQKSTKRAVKYIRSFKEPKDRNASRTKFYDVKCIVCDHEFHPRHVRSKYCSHECQKKFSSQKKRNQKWTGEFRLNLGVHSVSSLLSALKLNAWIPLINLALRLVVHFMVIVFLLNRISAF